MPKKGKKKGGKGKKGYAKVCFFVNKQLFFLIKRNLKDKWKRKFELSDKACRVQEVFTDVGKRNCIGEEDRHNFSMLNQLLSGHTLLNQHRARLDENVSEMCPVCLSREDPEHFLFYCKAYT